ncbi:MAG: KGG domain-containing protein [Burkholderiaceae bacterium]
MASTKQDSKQGNKGAKQGDRTSMRGFASMDPNQQRAIASEGGRAAHRSGNAHEFTSEEARRAGSMSHKNSRKSSGNQGSAAAGNEGGGSARGGSSE